MASSDLTELESKVRRWIRKKPKETSRVEFKLMVPLRPVGAKAEFIRDVIALANSQGEFPREDAYLVIGFSEGKLRDVAPECYDGASLGQILDAYIFPSLRTLYQEFDNGKNGRVGVLTIKPDSGVLYVVRKKLLDDTRKAELLPGQSWGRKADRKVDLEGDAIHSRLCTIAERQVERATATLTQKIEKLESESGAVLDVKRIRFEIEGTRAWPELERLLDKLLPYATEFDDSVKHHVLDAVMHVTGGAWNKMPVEVAQSISTVLWELLPVGIGGMNSPSWKEISAEEQKLLERIGHAVFDLTWDSCRYLRDIEVVEVAARLYWALIRFSALNRLSRLQAQFLERAGQCREICNELRDGKPFPEAQQLLDEQIKDALDLPEHPKAKPTRRRVAKRRD
jgi:hypothetical protein